MSPLLELSGYPPHILRMLECWSKIGEWSYAEDGKYRLVKFVGEMMQIGFPEGMKTVRVTLDFETYFIVNFPIKENWMFGTIATL